MKRENKKKNRTVSTSIPAELDALFEREAIRQRRSKAAIIRYVLEKYGARALEAA